MDLNKELIIKLQSLEEENRVLKKILDGSSPPLHEHLFITDSLSGAVARNISQKAFTGGPFSHRGNDTSPPYPDLRLSNEKYISALSRRLNSLTDEKSVLRTVLSELAVKSGSAYHYYIQIDGTGCIISSIFSPGAEDDEIFSFQEYSSSKSNLSIDMEELYNLGTLIIKKTSSKGFFSSNTWLTEGINSVLLIPVIIQNEILGIIVIDITAKEKEVTPVEIMLYQTVSSIVTGSLKRIAYENRIRDRKERYELIIENTSHFLFQTLPDGIITFANRKFAELFDTDPDKINGRSLSSVTGIDPGIISSLLSEISEKTGSLEKEITVHEPGNNKKIVKLFVNPVKSESGNILLVNFLGEDITEKKLLEDELLKTKKRLDLAFLASNDAYWDANFMTGEFFYSHNFYRMLDYDSSDTPSVFRDFLKLVHPEDVPVLKDILGKFLKGELIRASIRFRARTYYGEYRWIFSRAMIIETDDNGTPMRIIGTNIDLTSTVRIEDKLKESETRLKMILDNMPVMLHAVDESGLIIHWNRECEHVTGYSVEEIIRNPRAGATLYPDENDRSHFFRILHEESGNYRNIESTITSSSGLKKTVLWSNLSGLYPVRGWYSWAVGIDITPLREAREALNESTYKLKEAQRIAHLGYWEYDHGRKIFTWDSTLAGIIGFGDGPVVLHDNEMLNHIHEDDRDKVIRDFSRCFDDREIHSEVIRFISRSGETVYIRQTSKTDCSHDGIPLYTRGICFDITELKKTEIELLKAKERAEESSRLKTAFLANMSHEVRTPLNSIMSFSELISDSEISSGDKENYAEIIKESSRQLTSLISDIIDISKIDANLMVINKKPFHLNKIIDHICEVFRNEIKEKEITISCSKALDDSCDVVITDETRVRQILNNLIYNAIKFTESGTVDFGYSISEDRKFIQFHVSDTGIGIPKNRQKMIFGRFKQADASIGRKYGGTGLGLSISRELCRMLGGKIWVRSELKKGSTFSFKIPFEQADPGEFTTGLGVLKESEHKERLKDRKILIVDDNKSVHKLLAAIFKKYGALPVSAESASDAINALIADSSIDIVLLDIQMPDIDGTVLINMIKELNRKLPVIAQTANALEDDRRRYLELGFDGYIAKPYDRDDLLHTVSSLINNP